MHELRRIAGIMLPAWPFMLVLGLFGLSDLTGSNRSFGRSARADSVSVVESSSDRQRQSPANAPLGEIRRNAMVRTPSDAIAGLSRASPRSIEIRASLLSPPPQAPRLP